MEQKIRVVSFTQTGSQLAGRIFLDWEPEEVILRLNETGDLSEWTKEAFLAQDAICFIGACGIAVRTIAPFVKDKLSDSPVLVMDELGQYVIPILSGHVGGANELARRIAAKSGAAAVITTATDLHKKFAVDVFAKKNELSILNKEGIVKVSSKILKGEPVTVAIQPDTELERANGLTPAGANYGLSRIASGRIPEELTAVAYPPEETVDIVVSADPMALQKGTIRLKPKQYVLGIGCKKGKTREEIQGFVQTVLLDWNPQDIAAIASIDRKAEEPGIVEWANAYRIPFVTFTEDELNRVPGHFSSSIFVENQVGVDNVCERSAIKAAGPGSRLVMKKQAGNGITLAMAKKDWSIVFDES
jgi:cobalt-precorrin 5A hydrolase